MNMPLAARLVMASACDTWKPEDAGVAGMARAFHHAGASRVIVSAWKVDDLATERLMTEFAQELPAGAPEQALRRAMLAVRIDRPDPSSWASFTELGSPSARFDGVTAGTSEEVRFACERGTCAVAFRGRESSALVAPRVRTPMRRSARNERGGSGRHG